MYFDFVTYARAARGMFREPFEPKRALFLAAVFVGLTFMGLFSALCLALDHVFFPGFRRARVRQPIFIVGNGRSGTTHMHRLLSGDTGRFSFFRTYEMPLPSILQRKLVWALGRLDAHLLGGALRRRLRVTEDAALEDVRGKHGWRLDGSEEDEMILFNCFNTGWLTWLFPYEQLDYVLTWDDKPLSTRRRILGYYKGLIQRQLYLYGTEKIHCAKSPGFTQKVRGLLEAFPDARFVMMFRHPAESIPSLVDLMSWYWRGFGVGPELVADAAERLGEQNVENYRYLAKMIDELPEAQRHVVPYEALVSDPKQVVEEIYARFGLEISPEYERFLDAERRAASEFVSGHDYDPAGQGPARARLHAELGELYARFGWAP